MGDQSRLAAGSGRCARRLRVPRRARRTTPGPTDVAHPRGTRGAGVRTRHRPETRTTGRASTAQQPDRAQTALRRIHGCGAAAALRVCAILLQAPPDDQYLIAMQATALRLLNDPRYEALCDYNKMVLSQALETPPGWSDLTSFLADLISRLNALHNPHGHRLLYQSLRQGTETTQDLSRSQDPVIQALFHSFAAPIRAYRNHIGQGQDPLRRRNRGASRFNGSWSVRLHRAGYHTSHVHPRGWISSACYIQLPDSMRAGHTAEGILSFGAPGMITTPSVEAEFSLHPEVGQLVLS